MSERHERHERHEKHASHSVAMFRQRFWVALALTVPTTSRGEMLPRVFGFMPPRCTMNNAGPR